MRDGAGRRRTEGLGPAVLRPARTHAQGAVEAGAAAGLVAEVRLGERRQRPGGRGHGGAHGHPPGHRLRHRGRHTAPGERGGGTYCITVPLLLNFLNLYIGLKMYLCKV